MLSSTLNTCLQLSIIAKELHLEKVLISTAELNFTWTVPKQFQGIGFDIQKKKNHMEGALSKYIVT